MTTTAPPMCRRVAALVAARDADPHEQRSAQWYAMREAMLTASDVAAVLGANAYKTADAVMREKTNQVAPFAGSSATQFGVVHEDAAVDAYERATGARVLRFGLMRHAKLPWLGASPDGVTTDGRLVEIKVR